MRNKYQKIGIIGGGQLAMFLAKSCQKFNLDVTILESFKDCSAIKYANNFILGKQNNFNDLARLFSQVDCVIFENENLDVDVLTKIENQYPGKLLQTSLVMKITQHRLNEKIFLNNLSIKTAQFFLVKTFEDIILFHKIFASDLILKTTRFGYDGKNQIYIKHENLEQQKLMITKLLSDNECIIEKVCPFKYEISLIFTYKNKKSVSCLPITKNTHKNGILFKSELIKNLQLEKKAKEIAKTISQNLPNCGILTIEFFVTNDDQLIVNELAPRVHNSGHHSLDNCLYSQFDLMIMNILDINKSNKLINNLYMYNILGQSYNDFKNYLPDKNVKYHFYDYFKKDVKNNRKMAHINTDINLDDLIKT